MWLINMFETLPREFSRKRFFINSMEVYLNHINFFNTKDEVYTNTYSYKETYFDEYNREKFDRKSIIIDRIPFDFDTDGAYEDMYELYCYLKGKNISQTVVFSGRGYHVYIHTKIDTTNTILDVSLFQNKIVKQLGLNVDPTIVGNPSHLIRIPGTYNKRRGRFCISLTEEEINTSHEEICELAKVQRKGIIKLEGGLFKLEHYKSSDTLPDFPTFNKPLEDLDIDLDLLIPCLTTNIRSGGYLPHNERVWICQYLSEIYRNGRHPSSLNENELNGIVNEIVDFFEDIVVDFDRNLTRKYVKGIVKKYLNSPSCNTLKMNGKCVENEFCWRRGN